MYLIDSYGEYPRFLGDLLIDHPDWKIGDELPTGWQEVAEGVMPIYDEATQICVELKPDLVDGILTRNFDVRSLTSEEIKARQVWFIRSKVEKGQSLTAEEAALLIG
jgi:hypothetical protein